MICVRDSKKFISLNRNGPNPHQDTHKYVDEATYVTERVRFKVNAIREIEQVRLTIWKG